VIGVRGTAGIGSGGGAAAMTMGARVCTPDRAPFLPMADFAPFGADLACFGVFPIVAVGVTFAADSAGATLSSPSSSGGVATFTLMNGWLSEEFGSATGAASGAGASLLAAASLSAVGVPYMPPCAAGAGAGRDAGRFGDAPS